ncbi:alpha/beta hydrolase [Pinirhizobacter soli]|uniref:alpha/beta hydrolase n=1 Tax=Pinirhizobacter soli TaxID=2786953 RepID=UPI00202A30A8|nr:alpha/beta hydrolase [Pinirhizobacter soli]
MNNPLRHLVKFSVVLIWLIAPELVYAANSSACLDVKPGATSSSYQTQTMQASDGVCLRSFAWQPAQIPARGVVVVVHGIRDYALRYEGFAQQLSQQGFAVFAQDLRGHGYSGGQRQRFDSMTEMVADVDLVVREAQERYPGVPLFVYGHSLGGLITTEYALVHGDKLSGVILSGAALKRPLSVTGFKVGLARIVAAIAPGAHVVAVDDHEFSRDKAVMATLESDTLISHQKLPAISAVAGINGMQDAQKKMGQLTMPLLILYGTADKVNPVEGSRSLYSGAGSHDKTLKPYEGLYHDLLHEPEHDRVAADVVAWLNSHTSTQAVGPTRQATQ